MGNQNWHRVARLTALTATGFGCGGLADTSRDALPTRQSDPIEHDNVEALSMPSLDTEALERPTVRDEMVSEACVTSCFNETLPECPAGLPDQVNECGCGCVQNIPELSDCRQSCGELNEAGECRGIDQFPSQLATKEQWVAELAESDWYNSNGAVLEGQCPAEYQFVYRTDGYFGEVRYFDREGQFLALSNWSDGHDPICSGRFFWPEPLPCEDATVTALLGGGASKFYEVGKSISLPWAAGPWLEN